MNRPGGTAADEQGTQGVLAGFVVVSPGNKAGQDALQSFAGKVRGLLDAAVHVLILDLFPPGLRDPKGVHRVIRGDRAEDPFVFAAGQPLTLAAYTGGERREAFIEPVAVGAELPGMPLFLTPDEHVLVPLEATYRAAWDAVPEFWRAALTDRPPGEEPRSRG